MIGNCAALAGPPGRMGRAVPGHDVAIIDGEIAIRADGDPVVFLGYWGNEPRRPRRSSTAGCARATTARWTRTARSASSAAPTTYLERRLPDRPGEIEDCLGPPPGRRDGGGGRRSRRAPRRGREGIRRRRRRRRRDDELARAPGVRSRAPRRVRVPGSSSSSTSSRHATGKIPAERVTDTSINGHTSFDNGHTMLRSARWQPA